MALDVIYMRGSKERYEQYLKAGKIVPTTFYYLDEKELYLGTIKLSNQEDIELAKVSLENTLANDYVTKEALKIALDEIKESIENSSGIFEFAGAFETLPTSMDDFSPGNVILITAGENAGKRFICNKDENGVKVWVEIENSGELDFLLEKINFIEAEMEALKVRLNNLETKEYVTTSDLVTLNTNLTKAINDEKTRAQLKEDELERRIADIDSNLGSISTGLKDLSDKVSSTENLLVWEG